eukprot:TRINITY_DN3164_c2_g1_i1.p1 TRINITY_DN3164_c2_g1~~TRINITY_DN3164_c2_g1_i1.p1  ORF type:complete len:1215 (+),score=110.64 TRINITY_DN3164_c2_g1_i1:8004-11648(+)
MRTNGPHHRVVPSQVTINAPIKVLNLVGTKKCIVLSNNKIKRVTSPNKNTKNGLLNIFQTVDKDIFQPLFTQSNFQPLHTQTPALVVTSNPKSHARHVSTMERPRKKNIHDLMLDQELQTFREEVEWRYRNSQVNKTYRFPLVTTKREMSPVEISEEPNYMTIPMSVYDMHDKSSEESRLSSGEELRTSRHAQSVMKSCKKAEFCKRVKDILTGGTYMQSRNTNKETSVQSCTNKQEKCSGFFQTQRVFFSPEHKRQPSKRETSKVRNLQTIKTYMGELIQKSSRTARREGKMRKVESGVFSEQSKEDTQERLMNTYEVKSALKKVHLRAKTLEKEKYGDCSKEGLGEAGKSGGNTGRTAQKVTTPRHLKIIKMHNQFSTKTIAKPPKQKPLPPDFLSFATVHDFNSAVIPALSHNETYALNLPNKNRKRLVKTKNLIKLKDHNQHFPLYYIFGTLLCLIMCNYAFLQVIFQHQLNIASMFLVLLIFFLSIPHVFLNDSCIFNIVSSNFTNSVANSPSSWLLKFYAEWCEPCKRISHVWTEAANILCEGHDISVGQVNSQFVLGQGFNRDEQVDLKYQLEISHLPTIMVIEQQKCYIFEGEVTVDRLVNFARGGFKDVEPVLLKPSKGIIGKLAFIVSLNIEAFMNLFDSIGLSFLPKLVKALLLLIILLLPVAAVLVSVKVTQEPAMKFDEAVGAEEGKTEKSKTEQQRTQTFLISLNFKQQWNLHKEPQSVGLQTILSIIRSVAQNSQNTQSMNSSACTLYLIMINMLSPRQGYNIGFSGNCFKQSVQKKVSRIKILRFLQFPQWVERSSEKVGNSGCAQSAKKTVGKLLSHGSRLKIKKGSPQSQKYLLVLLLKATLHINICDYEWYMQKRQNGYNIKQSRQIHIILIIQQMLDLLAFIFFTLVFAFIVYFLFFRGKGKKPQEETETVPLRRRRHLLAERGRLLAEEHPESGPEDDSDEVEDDEDVIEGQEELSKREIAKLIKKKEKEKRKRAQEAERAEREAKLEQKRQYQSEKYRKREEERLAREMEEKKLEEEQKKKEEEEYAQWKMDFTVDQVGAEADEDEAESQSKLAEFMQYVTCHKVVHLNDLAAEFSMATTSIIDRIKDLEKDGRLTGIMDDRGKYIYISPEEFKALGEFIKKVGRINKVDLVRECNKIIKLKVEEADKRKLQDEVAAMERELESQVVEQEFVEVKEEVKAEAQQYLLGCNEM